MFVVPRAAKRLPWLKVLALAEVLLLARRHVQLLAPLERRRFAELTGRALRERRLPPEEREELARLVRRMEPRRFAGGAVDKLSPVRLPRRFLYGKKKDR
jgi:hypothetical protein